MSVGKHWMQTGNSVTCPAGVMRPTLLFCALGALMNDSVNQKLPSFARMMCSGLLPVVGTLNCFNLSGGAADATVARVEASMTATATASRFRTRRVIIRSCRRLAPQLGEGDDAVRYLGAVEAHLTRALCWAALSSRCRAIRW